MIIMSKINIIIFVIFIISNLNNVNGAIRFKRQRSDFFFPEDDVLNELLVPNNPNLRPSTLPPSTQTPPFIRIPPPTLAPPTFAPIPTQNPITSTTLANNNNNNNNGGLRTTPSPQFIRCMKTCPTTSEYNPICGSDTFVYHNQQKLDCARRCGSDVQMVGRGNCLSVFGQSAGRW